MNEIQKVKRKNTFIVTSPKLAGRLLYAGFELKETVNPFNQNHWRAWEITLSIDSAKAIKAFYDEIQRDAPYIITKWLDDPKPEMDEVDQNG